MRFWKIRQWMNIANRDRQVKNDVLTTKIAFEGSHWVDEGAEALRDVRGLIVRGKWRQQRT
jgi:hypothetical protein